MTNFTASADKALDAFYADMTNVYMLDTVDMMDAEDRDYTPVPREYWGMSYAEVCEDIAEYEAEVAAAYFAQQQIPYRWQ